MKKLFLTLFVILILFPSIPCKGTDCDRQAGFSLGYRSGIFYQVSSDEAGNAEIAYNAMLSFRKEGYSLQD